MIEPLRIVLFALTTVIALATALPFVQKPAWWIRSLDFPRIQIAALAALVLAGLGAVVWARGEVSTADWAAGVTLAVCLLYQGARMLPYSPLWRVQTARGNAAGSRAVAAPRRLQRADVQPRW